MGRHLAYHLGYILLFLSLKVSCYEKTLRKIVRNQSKMVQTPFSNGGDLVWKNASQSHLLQNQALLLSSPMKSTFHKSSRTKMSTILSSVETGRGKSTYSKMKIAKNDASPIELRLARNTFFGNFSLSPHKDISDSHIGQSPTYKSNHKAEDIAIESFYQMPTKSKFFPSVDDHEIQSLEQRSTSKENTIVIPENIEKNINDSVLLKGVFVAAPKTESKSVLDSQELKIRLNVADPENERADFLLEGMQADTNSLYSYNITANPYSCTDIKEVKADIDAQEIFAEIDIEPLWTSRKHFWNSIFDSRYESLMRNPNWPPLKVILIPRTHVDSIWKRTFNQYHNESVSKILSNIVKKLQFYSNLTFNWNEVSHLSQWWKNTSPKSRTALRKLLKSGRLEITSGGWVEPDEATTHLFGLVHQLVEGHQWLKHHLDYTPRVGWQTNTVSHSPTMPYILSASDITRFVFTNIHYSLEKYLSEYQYSDFIWLQDWNSERTLSTPINDVLNKMGQDRYPKHSVMTHYMQFNSAGFKACGPNKAVCVTDFNFAKSNKNIDIINTYNVKEKSELLLEQYSKAGTLSAHNIIMAPIGGPYRYELQSEFDYQYNNYQKLADFINTNRDIYKATVEFGTPTDYFNALFNRRKHFQTLKGDFLNFADINSGIPAYWTGFYTSRPLIKILLRRLESTLRSTEILLTFGIHYNAFTGYNATDIFALLVKARETVARLLDRNVSMGTLTANALKYAHSQMLQTVRDCWYIQEVVASLLSTKPEERQQQKAPYLQKYVYSEGEFISTFKAVSPGDQIYIFNSLSHERTEVVELVTRNPNVRIIDHRKKDVTVQINPIWNYNSDNFINISRRFFKISFAVAIPPLTLELFRIKDTYDSSYSFSTIYCLTCIIDDITSVGSIFPFTIQPIQAGDIQLESYKHRLIFDEFTGFMKTVVEKDTNIEKTVVLDYGAFRDSDVNSGMFLFNTNVSKPLYDVLMPYRVGTKNKIVMIISGQVTTELITIYGRFLQHSVKIYNIINSPLSSAIYVESKVDYEVSPKNRELELFLSIQTDIGNGNPPQIFTDNNGFQYTKRLLNITRRIESNMYPITSMAYIQDQRSRLTFITDHAQGVTALQEGQLVVMLDRRVLYNDGRGTNEGLADSSATCHRHVLILENFVESPQGFTQFPPKSVLSLPSLPAIYLANCLSYQLDVFITSKIGTDKCYYTFLPLIKTSFPCDVLVLNYRLVLNEELINNYTPNTALLILHRQSISCQVNHGLPQHCNGEAILSLNKIFHNVKAAYQTNLVGTSKGVPLQNLNQVSFPPMELTTLKIYF